MAPVATAEKLSGVSLANDLPDASSCSDNLGSHKDVPVEENEASRLSDNPAFHFDVLGDSYWSNEMNVQLHSRLSARWIVLAGCHAKSTIGKRHQHSAMDKPGSIAVFGRCSETKTPFSGLERQMQNWTYQTNKSIILDFYPAFVSIASQA